MKAHPVREYRYTKDHGSFYLFAYDDGERIGAPILMSDRLAVAFDPESFTLHKHGSPDGVRQWLDDVKTRGPLPWPIEIAEFAPDFPVDELNRALSNSTYLRTMFAKLTEADGVMLALTQEAKALLAEIAPKVAESAYEAYRASSDPAWIDVPEDTRNSWLRDVKLALVYARRVDRADRCALLAWSSLICERLMFERERWDPALQCLQQVYGKERKLEEDVYANRAERGSPPRCKARSISGERCQLEHEHNGLHEHRDDCAKITW